MGSGGPAVTRTWRRRMSRPARATESCGPELALMPTGLSSHGQPHEPQQVRAETAGDVMQVYWQHLEVNRSQHLGMPGFQLQGRTPCNAQDHLCLFKITNTFIGNPRPIAMPSSARSTPTMSLFTRALSPRDCFSIWPPTFPSRCGPLSVPGCEPFAPVLLPLS